MNSYDQRDEDRDQELSSIGRQVSGIFFLAYHELLQGFEDEICTAGHNYTKTHKKFGTNIIMISSPYSVLLDGLA